MSHKNQSQTTEDTPLHTLSSILKSKQKTKRRRVKNNEHTHFGMMTTKAKTKSNQMTDLEEQNNLSNASPTEPKAGGGIPLSQSPTSMQGGEEEMAAPTAI